MTSPNPAQLEKEARELYEYHRKVGRLADQGGTTDWHSLSAGEKENWRQQVCQIQDQSAHLRDEPEKEAQVDNGKQGDPTEESLKD